jgi:flagellar biosynthesis component FlhA
MEYNTIITLSSIALCILMFFRSILNRETQKRQKNTIQKLKDELQTIKEKQTMEQEFQNSLRHAEVSNELQKSRTVYSNKKETVSAPERYGYARSMFQSGMTTDKIASALGMSIYETGQLLKLTNLTVRDNEPLT